MPQVSVVIPTFNHAKYLREAVDSVLAQSFRDYEIIVVDDGSTDETRSVVATYIPQVRYIYQENRGPSAARNSGIRASHGEFIAFLDSDDLWLPEKLEKQLRRFELSPAVGLVYSDLYYFNDTSGFTLGTYPAHHFMRSGRVLKQLFLENFIQTPTLIVRSQVFDSIGYFDESLWSCEDWDMWLRIAAHFEIGFVDEPLAKHRLHLGNRSKQVKDRDTFVVLQRALDATLSLSVELGALKNRKFAAVHTKFALSVLETGGNSKTAREHLRNAIRLNPRRLQSYVYLALTFFKPSIAIQALAWKDRLIHRIDYA